MDNNVTSIILAGGQGTRLHPLTQSRSKPAVPIGGKFRLIDIPISNCLHHRIRTIWVLTQFASESLHRHIFQAYRLDGFSGGFVSVLAASQTVDNKGWYQGTADAVRKNLANFTDAGDAVLLLSGDHLYRMDFTRFIDFHRTHNADITLSVIPVSRSQVPELGVLKMAPDYRVLDFVEKPRDSSVISSFAMPHELRPAADGDAERTHVGSMGIYLFNKKVLFDVLRQFDFIDFGKQIIPAAMKTHKMYAYPFDGYWEDIGTIRAFFDAHISMTGANPPFNFYDETHPFFTNTRFLPAAKISGSNIDSSIICEGSMIENAKISDSVVGVRSIIRDGSHLSRVVLMGADSYQNASLAGPRVGIGKNCHIRNAILDKDVSVGEGAVLINKDSVVNGEKDGIVVRDGIIIVPKGVNVPPRYVL
jgi:glucose-1-phosphate adenylyltransferase